MTPTPPPAIYVERPAEPLSMMTVDQNGKIEIDWSNIRNIARNKPTNGDDRTAWIIARGLMVAHGENPDAVLFGPCTILPVPGNITLDGTSITAPIPNAMPAR